MVERSWTEQVGQLRELIHSWRLLEAYYLVEYHLADFDRWEELRAYVVSHLGEAQWNTVRDFVEDHFIDCETLALHSVVRPELLAAAVRHLDHEGLLESLHQTARRAPSSPLIAQGTLGPDVEEVTANVPYLPDEETAVRIFQDALDGLIAWIERQPAGALVPIIQEHNQIVTLYVVSSLADHAVDTLARLMPGVGLGRYRLTEATFERNGHDKVIVYYNQRAWHWYRFAQS